jgi:hypothetical protein
MNIAIAGTRRYGDSCVPLVLYSDIGIKIMKVSV